MSDLLAARSDAPPSLDAALLRRLVGAGRRLAAVGEEDDLVLVIIDAARALTDGHAALDRGARSGPGRARDRTTDRGAGDGPGARSSRYTAPILSEGAPWARLSVERPAAAGELGPELVDALDVLVEWASAAAERVVGRAELERRHGAALHTAQVLAATTVITRAIGDETDLGRVLELVVEHGRRLVDARAMVISLPVGDELEIAAAAGEVGRATRGARIPMSSSTSGAVLRSGVTRRSAAADLLHAPARMGLHGVRSSMLVPLVFRGRALGVLAALDRQSRGPDFSPEDEELLEAFAASAAIAVATAQHVGESRLRDALAGAEQERRRWARELHDETLQGLAGLRLRLELLGRRTLDPDTADGVRAVTAGVAEEIGGLRALITALRPAALDELGLRPALESLVHHVSRDSGVVVDLRLDLPGHRLRADDETTVFRIVQEALVNVVKHAGATSCRVAVTQRREALEIAVVDDGRGTDPEVLERRQGFGVTGMRERATLAGGSLRLEAPDGGGTAVRATLPSRPAS